MNSRDRAVTSQIYSLLNTMTAIGPGNPAYTESFPRALKTVNVVSRHLMHAVLDLQIQDHESANRMVRLAQIEMDEYKARVQQQAVAPQDNQDWVNEQKHLQTYDR